MLARQNFTDPLVAIPSALSSLFRSIIASGLIAPWRRSPLGDGGPESSPAAR